MTLRQLRLLLEIVRQGNHISAAAEASHVSQPAVSKQIRLLEAELGFALFTRKRNQVLGLTDLGREVLEVARRMLADADNLRHIREDFVARDSGNFTIAATHTQARYLLPRIIERFVTRHPKIQLGLLQGNPTQICELVDAGEADMAIGTEGTRAFPNLVMLPCFELSQIVVVKAGHPLLKVKKPTLSEIAKYPIIAHRSNTAGPWRFSGIFERGGLTPKVISSAVDADVCKIYVELGLGITILSAVVFDRSRDTKLRAIDASHLFEPMTTFVSLRRNTYLRSYVLDIIQALATGFTPDEIGRAVKEGGAETLIRRTLPRF